jgi:(p)ppGpp synthase/HD superfamily hydrolase
MEKCEILENYIKSKTALRYWLLGRNYIKAVEAMDYALKYHKGFRKDKITPEFQHQVYIANFVRVYEPLLVYPEETFITIFLHDVMEDYNVSVEEISNIFGPIVSESVYKVSKIYKGSKKEPIFYFNEISKCSIASVVKGADRVHNINSMLGV